MKSKALIPLGILLVAFCFSCGREDTAPDPDQLPPEIEQLDNLTVISADAEPQFDALFERERAFGEIFGQVQFGPSPYLHSVVDAQGRVIIPNESEKFINVYDSTGTKITTLGREGKGPGEFISLTHMDIIGNELYAKSANGIGLNFFSLDSLQLSQTLYLEPELEQEVRDSTSLRILSPRFYLPVDQNTLLAAYRDYAGLEPAILRLKFYLLNRQGKLISEELFRAPSYERFRVEISINIPGGVVITTLPVGRKTLFEIDSNAHIYYARTDTPLVEVRDTTGIFRRGLYLDVPRVEVNADEVIKQKGNESLAEGIRKLDLPPVWPAFDSMIIDDEDRIWISTIVEDFEVYQWWVLDTGGELLARFDWPRDKPIAYIRNGKIYTRETNQEKYFDQIVRYDMTLTDAAGS